VPLDAVPPAGRRFGIVAHATNVAERNVELALEGPQLIQSLDFEKVIVSHGDFDHAQALYDSVMPQTKKVIFTERVVAIYEKSERDH